MNSLPGLANGHPALKPAAAQPEPARTLPIELRFSGRDDALADLRQLVPLDFSVADGQPFGGNAIVARLHGMTVAELRFEATHLARRRPDAPRTSDAVQVVLQLAGRSRVRQGPSSCTL